MQRCREMRKRENSGSYYYEEESPQTTLEDWKEKNESKKENN